MVIIAVTIAFAAALCWLALRANTRFQDNSRLPMQWWMNGEVTWSAPRVVALSLLPVLAILTMGLDALAALTLRPRPGQEGYNLPVLIGLGAAFLAIQYLHLWMIERSLKRNGS